MVVAAAAAQQQHQQQQQVSTASTTAEEEALKRNTDCVYFLASPLTCKKGSECEYRHSEYARVNPRDCYFWLNGNCLNPKCGFRHPPLDGLLGTQTAVSTGSSFPSSHSATVLAAHAPNNSGKQAVPCIFFQKGLCIKGDKCAFLHGPNTTVNKASQPTAAVPANEPPTLKKASAVIQKCTQEQKGPPANVPKAVVVRPEANKSTHKAETAFPRNAAGNERDAPPPSGTDDEFPQYKATNVPPVINGNSLNRSNRLHQAHALDDQSFQHGKDADEFLRESSPGFDVLVDDELRDSDYYHDEDQYGRTRGHEGRDLNSVNEYDIGRSADYSSLTEMGRETFRDPRGYDIGSYDHISMQGQYAWEQRMAASDRVLVGGSSNQERRSYSKSETHNQINESDLRYRLSKHRRANGLRSVVSPDYAHAPENQIEEQYHRSSTRRDSHHLASQESSLSGRLRGRIKLPRRSPVSGSDLRSERDLDRGRNWGSVSPGRPQTSHQGRLRDRIKGRVEDGYNNGGRNFRGPRMMRREMMDDRDADFAGPKSLSELKGGKNAESKEQQSLRKRKSLEDNQQPEGGLSFDGPMPLSEILKRKRGAGAATSASTGISSANMQVNNPKESQGSMGGGSNNTAAQSAVSTVSKEVSNNKEAGAVKETEGKNEATHLEAEDGMIAEEGIEDHDLEVDDQRDGEYDYEQGDEGDYNYEEGENAEGEEEYLEDEDGDDFAKKIGVMFS